MGPHAFIIHLDPQSCRYSGLPSETAFDRVTDALNWRMSYHPRVFHCSNPEMAAVSPMLRVIPEFTEPLEAALSTAPAAPMRLKDKRRKQTLSVCSKYGSYVPAETEDSYDCLYRMDGTASGLITRSEAHPIAIREAGAYVKAHHHHNAGPKLHKFSLCLRIPEEPESVGVVTTSIPKARRQMDGMILEINRCCTDSHYTDVCNNLYARTVRIGREMGYTRFLIYIPSGEGGSNLRAVGFQPDDTVHDSSHGQDSPSRPRTAGWYPSGDELGWVLLAP